MKYGPFVKYYGLKFKNYKPVDASLKYSAVEKGEFDVTEVYATDGLNIKAKLKILEDDKQFFPEYNGCYVIRQDAFERFASDAPNLRQILSQLDGKISTEQMARLTYDVDVKGKSVDEVAEGFLKEQGLL
jgi:glycine betaine/choline ABC-type transport system substrate-binding protein